MFGSEGDDDADATLGAVRYPVMPSLVGLQQMRNRLHLAYLGKKLMKWTALATGKQLRKLAVEMGLAFQSYAEDMRTAFMLLARCRYFTPHVNSVVQENIAKHASVTISVYSKSKGGVKVVMLKATESGVEPYPYLAIGLGGIAVREAKQAWLRLLKLMIKILEQRVTFQQVEIVHKNATKKQNVLTRVIIPKIVVTMRYITSELDEQEREESFRLKRFKQLKYKNKESDSPDAAAEAPVAPCGTCAPPPPKGPPPPKVKPKKVEPPPAEQPARKKVEPPKKPEEKGMDDKMIKSITDKITIPEILKDEQLMETLSATNMCACCLSLFAVKSESDEFLCPLCLMKAKALEKNEDLSGVVPCRRDGTKLEEYKERLKNLMLHLKNEGMDEPCGKVCGDVKEEEPKLPCVCSGSEAKMPAPEPTPAPCAHPCGAVPEPTPAPVPSPGPCAHPCGAAPEPTPAPVPSPAPCAHPCGAAPEPTPAPCAHPCGAAPEPKPAPCGGAPEPKPAPCGAAPEPKPAPCAYPCGAAPEPKPAPEPTPAPCAHPCGAAPEPKPAPCGAAPELKPAPCGAAPEPKPTPCAHPCGAAPEPKPAPCGAAPEPKPAPCGAAPESKPAPCGAAPEPKPAPCTHPCGAAPEPKPAPCGAAPEPKPAPCGAAPEPKPAPCGGSPEPKPAPCGAAPESSSVPCAHPCGATPEPKPAPCGAAPEPKPAPCGGSPEPKPAPCGAAPESKPAPCAHPCGAAPEPKPAPCGVAPEPSSAPCAHPCGATPEPKLAPCGGAPEPKPAPCGAAPESKPAPCGGAPEPKPAPCGAAPEPTPAPCAYPCGAAPEPKSAPCGAAPESKPAPCGAAPGPKPAPCGGAPEQKPAPCSAAPEPKSAPCGGALEPKPAPCGGAPEPKSAPCGAAPEPKPAPCGAAPKPTPGPCAICSAPELSPPPKPSPAPCAHPCGAAPEPSPAPVPSPAPGTGPCSRESSHPPSVCVMPTESSDNTFTLSSAPAPKLGYFEKKYKEIVKVTRLRNPDGTICEEKQVITIRTERRNPHGADGKCGAFKEQKYIGTCSTDGSGFGGGSCGGGSGGAGTGAASRKGGASICCSVAKRGEVSSGTCGSGGGRDAASICGSAGGYSDRGGVNIASGGSCGSGGRGSSSGKAVGTQSPCCKPTVTKSEALKRSSPMGHLKPRSCASANSQKSVRSGRSQASSSGSQKCICYFPKKKGSKDKVKPSSKVSTATSVDSKLCCPEQSRFVCSTELQSGPPSPKSPKCVTKTKCVQTSYCELPGNATADKASCCMTNCDSEQFNRAAKKLDNKTMNTESERTEDCTSCGSPKKPTTTPSPTFSCMSKSKDSSNSGCTIKIMSRPPKVCGLDQKDDDSEVIIRGDMLKALRKMIAPKSKSTQCCHEEPENLCSQCQSKITPKSSQKCKMTKSKNNSACYTCRAKSAMEKEEGSNNDYCSCSGMISCTSASNKSAAAGSLFTGCSLTDNSMKSSAQSVCSDYKSTCSCLAQTIRSTSIPSYAPGENICLKCVTPTPAEVLKCCKDAMTSTKTCDRYDCRPMRGFKSMHACEKIRSDSSACHSDTHMLRQRRDEWRECPPLQQTQSYCDESCISKWYNCY